MKRNYDDYIELFKPFTIDIPKGFVLDSGCGMGFACRDISDLHGDHTKVLGITLTESSSVHPIIFHNMVHPLPLKFRLNLVIDVYGSLSYSSYPLLIIANIMEFLVKDGKIIIYCTFLGRLKDIHDVLEHIDGINSDHHDDKLFITKTTDNMPVIPSIYFYPASMAS